MLTLQKTLDQLIETLSEAKKKELKDRLDNLISVYPFNEFEFIISSLMGLDKISLDDYYEIRDEYIARNMFLHIFEISAPRVFGEQWAQGHLMELVPELVKPSKKSDPGYSGQYDVFLDLGEDGIKIEVKASRAVDFDSKEALYVKALSTDSGKPFDMNFQQVKPKCCDVFVFMAVWRDKIRYWVFPSKDIKNNKYYSDKQHRGNEGEGQIHFTEKNLSEFDKYLVPSNNLYKAIIEAYKAQME